MYHWCPSVFAHVCAANTAAPTVAVRAAAARGAAIAVTTTSF